MVPERRHQATPVPAFVVVSGLPASGKTTLAAALAKALRFQCLDKDAFLERLFDLEGTGDSQHRRQLSMRADAQFRSAALAADRAVLCSWWRHPTSTVDSGTPTAWLLLPGRAVVEVHCKCSAGVSADRFAARVRHPGHLDESRSRNVVFNISQQQEHFGPLFPDRAIVVDTERTVATSDVVNAIQSALHQQRVALDVGRLQEP